ncbi:MAG TPA: head GIN domain-containing protein [Allosphingosinicella sp.]|nr:head GIN domain-containing protein [Allosphingosinicella sp.]
MKRILITLALAVACSAPAAAAERNYSVTDFDRIIVEGPFTVRLATGRPSSARASGVQAALDRVSLEVQGRTLRVRPNRSAWGGYPGAASGPVAIEISTRELRSASVNGAGSLSIDRAGGLRLDLAVEGSGRITAPALAADTLNVAMIGSGRIEVAGTAGELRASVHGWGDLDASALRTQGATIVTDTAGRVAVAVARQATVTASGIGEVAILGSPACTVRGPSAAQVTCGNGQRR